MAHNSSQELSRKHSDDGEYLFQELVFLQFSTLLKVQISAVSHFSVCFLSFHSYAERSRVFVPAREKGRILTGEKLLPKKIFFSSLSENLFIYFMVL